MAASNVNEVINKIEIKPVKDLFKKTQESVSPKYAQLCDGGVYMGIMNVYLNYMHRSSLKFCGNGWIKPLNGANLPAQNDSVSADPTYCKYHTLNIGDCPGKPPRTIDLYFEFYIFEQLDFYDIFTDPNDQLTYIRDLKNVDRYDNISCVITLTNPKKVDNDENFHGYDFQKIVIPNVTTKDPRVGQIIKRLAESNKYILEFQTIPMHAKVPGLYMTSTVGLPYEHLTVLLGGHGYKKTVKNGNARFNCKIFAQHKFDRDEWKNKKIIYTALKCLLTKFECMYNYLIDKVNTPKSVESFCQSLLDHITVHYIEAVMKGIDNIQEGELGVLSMVEIRQICESEFIRHYQFLLTHKWKFENGHFTFKLEDFRSRLSLSESNNGVCDVRVLAYNVVSSIIEPGQRLKNTAADCTIEVDEHGLGDSLSMRPDLETVDAGDKINVFNVHDVFRAFVSIYFLDRQVPHIFEQVLDDAKHLISNMKCYKTSSNIALKLLKKSCSQASFEFDDFEELCSIMLDTSENFITLLLHKEPSTKHATFMYYVQQLCVYLTETNDKDDALIVNQIPEFDEDVVHFKFNDMTPRYKESISITTFTRIVAATQLQILASMQRIENDPTLDISDLQFKNYIQLASDTEEGLRHESNPPTFGPICNIDNLMDILYPDSIRDAIDMDSLYFETLKTAIDKLKTRNSNPNQNEDDRQEFKKLYLKSQPPYPKKDENPVIFVTGYNKIVTHILLNTLNENRETVTAGDIANWLSVIKYSLWYIQHDTKKIFGEDVNCQVKFSLKDLETNSKGERDEVLRVVNDFYTLLKRKSYTNREIESEMKDQTAESIFNKHTTDTRKMSKEQFYSSWNDIMESKIQKPRTTENSKEDVFNRLSRPYNYSEKPDQSNNYIDLKSFKCLFLGNLKVNLYIEFVKILYFHIQIIVNLSNADSFLKPDTFMVKDPTDGERKENFIETQTNLEKYRLFLASQYSEWWNFSSDDRNSTKKIMEARSDICDNIYTDKSVDTEFIHGAFFYMNGIKCKSENLYFDYRFTDVGEIPVKCHVKNVEKLEIDRANLKVMIGYNLPGDGEHGLQKKWGVLPVTIPQKLKREIQNESQDIQFVEAMLEFTIHEREFIKIKLHDGTYVDVPLEPKLVCESSYKTSIFDIEATRVSMNRGRKYIWNFDTKVWEEKQEVWFMHRIAKIVDNAGDLHSALFCDNVVTAMQSLFRISTLVRHTQNKEIQQELKKICTSFQLPLNLASNTLERNMHVGNSNMHHLENLRKIAHARGKKIEADAMNLDIGWSNFETHTKSTLRYAYPCLVKIFFEILKCIQTQCIPSDKIDSIISHLTEIHGGSNGLRTQNGNIPVDSLRKCVDLATKCLNPNGTRDVPLKEVHNEELSNSQLSVILSNYERRRQSTVKSGMQHNHLKIPMTTANGNDMIKFEIKMLNFLIFDCMKIMNEGGGKQQEIGGGKKEKKFDMRQNLCLTESDAVVSYGTSEATRVHQIIQENNNSTYDNLKEKIRDVYKHKKKEKLFNYNYINKSDIIDFLQKKCLWYWDNVINLSLESKDMKDKFNTWTHYMETFLNQLLDKNTEAIFGTFYLYINGEAIRNMLQKLKGLTWDNLDSLRSSDLDSIYKLIVDKEYNQEVHFPVTFLLRKVNTDIVCIQDYKVLMSCSASEIISDDVLHVNGNGHIKGCYCSKLSPEEFELARTYGEVVDCWLDLIFVIVKIQLSFFVENRKGVGPEDWNIPDSDMIRPYFQKTQQYFRTKWAGKTQKDSLSMSKFASTQKLEIDKLISKEWTDIQKHWKITDNVMDVYKSYEKKKEKGGILLKCDLKLFLWTVIIKEIYPVVQLMAPPEEQVPIKRNILIIFNAAINNQIKYAQRLYLLFYDEIEKKYVNDRASCAVLLTRHMKYILNVCQELYRLPDFTDIKDLKFMYMSEGLNQIHMGPIQYKSVCQ
jgi:hypothetical protein